MSEVQAHAFLQAIYDAMACGVVVQDADGRTIHANRAAEQLLGMTRDQLFGKSALSGPWRTVDESGRESTTDRSAATRARLTGIPQRGVIGGRIDPDGSLHWMQSDAVPVFDAAGRVTQVVISFVEITAPKAAEGPIASPTRGCGPSWRRHRSRSPRWTPPGDSRTRPTAGRCWSAGSCPG